jgi:hypothetical protein
VLVYSSHSVNQHFGFQDAIQRGEKPASLSQPRLLRARVPTRKGIDDRIRTITNDAPKDSSVHIHEDLVSRKEGELYELSKARAAFDFPVEKPNEEEQKDLTSFRGKHKTINEKRAEAGGRKLRNLNKIDQRTSYWHQAKTLKALAQETARQDRYRVLANHYEHGDDVRALLFLTQRRTTTLRFRVPL